MMITGTILSLTDPYKYDYHHFSNGFANNVNP